MSKILYFAKVNLNTGDTFKSYNGDYDIIKNRMNKLASDMKTGISYTRKIEINKKNQTIKKEEEFEFGAIQRFDIDGSVIIVGDIIKTSKIFINKVVNKNTGEMVSKPMDNDEVIRFVFYPQSEIVSYGCTNRFGYKVFLSAFEGLINNLNEDSFIVKIQTNGLSMENLKEDLKKIKNIKELKIETIIPNPTIKLIEAINKGKEKLEDYELSRITGKTSIFKSNIEEGVDLESKQVKEEIEEIGNIHSALTAEEATGTGYVTLTAISRSGRVYNTNNKKVIKHELEDIVSPYELAKTIKEIIKNLFG